MKFEKIIEEAIEEVAKIFRSKKSLGKQVGETLAGVAIVGSIVKAVSGNQQEKVILTPVQEIYANGNQLIAYEPGSRAQGIMVAIIYEGSDNSYYKNVDGRWLTWNGSQWA